jgi:hypothetical protein
MKPITDIGALPGDRPRSSERPGFRISPLLSALVLLLIASMAHAQLSGDWFTVAGGGGTSTGGQLGLSGTAGQSDAGNMSGGSYILYGGFWGIAATWPPRLTITYSSGSVTVCWPLISQGYVLEQADSLANPTWSPVGPPPTETDAVTQCVTLPTGPTPKFYRLRRP